MLTSTITLPVYSIIGSLHRLVVPNLFLSWSHFKIFPNLRAPTFPRLIASMAAHHHVWATADYNISFLYLSLDKPPNQHKNVTTLYQIWKQWRVMVNFDISASPTNQVFAAVRAEDSDTSLVTVMSGRSHYVGQTPRKPCYQGKQW